MVVFDDCSTSCGLKHFLLPHAHLDDAIDDVGDDVIRGDAAAGSAAHAHLPRRIPPVLRRDPGMYDACRVALAWSRFFCCNSSVR